MEHARGAPYHPMTQAKIERWHQTPRTASCSKTCRAISKPRSNAAFTGSAVIEPVLWEDRFYSAHDGFQPQIARSADCDIVIAILRARLGTPSRNVCRRASVWPTRTPI
jgi:hypothetical protein